MALHRRNKRLATLNEALAYLRTHTKNSKFSKGTLYNAISSGRINRYGPYKPLTVDLNEIDDEFLKDWKKDEAG